MESMGCLLYTSRLANKCRTYIICFSQTYGVIKYGLYQITNLGRSCVYETGVTGKELTGKAANGIIHLINSGATALDRCV